jgi:hypothetical protein
MTTPSDAASCQSLAVFALSPAVERLSPAVLSSSSVVHRDDSRS